jgi:plastocyanin
MSKLLTDRARILPVLAVAVVIAVGSTLVIVLSGGSTATPSSPSAPSAVATVAGGKGKVVTVDIAMFAYHPSTLTVAPGTTVAFHNVDTTEHTATSKNATTFDTGPIQHNETKMVTLTEAGTFAYHCAFHPFMNGTIIVK